MNSKNDLEQSVSTLGYPVAKVTAERGLNLREGPGCTFAIHTILPKEAEVRVLKVWSYGPQGEFELYIKGWSYVFTGEVVGWVDSRFLKILENNNA